VLLVGSGFVGTALWLMSPVYVIAGIARKGIAGICSTFFTCRTGRFDGVFSSSAGAASTLACRVEASTLHRLRPAVARGRHLPVVEENTPTHHPTSPSLPTHPLLGGSQGCGGDEHPATTFGLGAGCGSAGQRSLDGLEGPSPVELLAEAFEFFFDGFGDELGEVVGAFDGAH